MVIEMLLVRSFSTSVVVVLRFFIRVFLVILSTSWLGVMLLRCNVFCMMLGSVGLLSWWVDRFMLRLSWMLGVSLV